MRRKIFLALVLVCNFVFFIPNSKGMLAEELHWACISDGLSLSLAEQDGLEDEFYKKINDLFVLTDLIDENYSSEEIAGFYKEGFKKAEKFGKTYYFVSLGIGLDTKYTDIICNTIANQDGIHLYDGTFNYAKNIVLSPYDADLSYSKEALVEEKFDPVNIGFWKTNTPVIFPVYIDSNGNYEISVLYSKRNKNGSRDPLNVYVLDSLPKDFSQEKLIDLTAYSVDLPLTGGWSNYVEKKLMDINLQAGNTYFIVLSDRNKTPGKGIMNLRNLFVRKLD